MAEARFFMWMFAVAVVTVCLCISGIIMFSEKDALFQDDDGFRPLYNWSADLQEAHIVHP